MSDDELTAARWMQLLEDVREKLGEGTIGGVAFDRRLESSATNGVWDLRLVADPLLGHVTQFRFFGRKELPTAFLLGPVRDPEETKGREKILTGDAAFDSQCTIWAAKPDHAIRMLSEGARVSIQSLWMFHPSLSLSVYPKSITILMPGVFLDRDAIIDFLLHVSALVQELGK